MDPVSIFVVPQFSEAEHIMEIMEAQSIPFSHVLTIASAFGLEEKVRYVKEETIKKCYYRKPAAGPDELVIVVR
jgi:hypothetical protein